MGSWSLMEAGRGGERGAGRAGSESERGQLGAGGRGCASGAGALIEVEVRNGFGFGRIVGGRLVEVETGIGVEGEVVLGRSGPEGKPPEDEARS
jgi:hypothetical protein